MNVNYNAGRAFEYERMKFYKREKKCDVWRSSGSKGPFDLTVVTPGGDMLLIQCKRCNNEATAMRLIRQFREHPPLGQRTRAHYSQIMEVKVKGSKEVISSWV